MNFSVVHGLSIAVLIGMIVVLFIRLVGKHVPCEDEFAHKAVIAAFNDWKQCTMAHTDSMRSEPEKVDGFSFIEVVSECE
uniref:TMhelix containing protein n=1 Tax=Angiostrongylus cantonensis TaxID=6313 RepID=A0A0K0D0Y0_ANGCA